MGKKPKMTRDTVPENFTLSLALVDALPVLLFGGSMALMGVFAARLDSSDVRSNWIEQLTNTAAQVAIFVGILLLF